MAKFTCFEEIQAWKKAREMVKVVNRVSKYPEFWRDFSLRDQIKRAGYSIMANIAEGFERGGNKEFIHFLTMAKGSAGEVKCLAYIALDQEYISKEEFANISNLCTESGAMIYGLIKYLKKSGLKGIKFDDSFVTMNNQL